MKFRTLLFIISLLFFSCKPKINKRTTQKSIPFAIVIHGGAGNITPNNFSKKHQKEYQLVLNKALDKGYEILNNGGKAVDAVQQTIAILENSPLFNAGKGAVFNSDGKNSFDASIMDGKSLDAGACAGVTNVKNPIFLAKKIMDKSNYVLLSGKGAEIFAEQNGLKFENDAYFYTKRQAAYLKKVQKAERKKSLSVSQFSVNSSSDKNLVRHNNHKEDSSFLLGSLGWKKYGTVGCVALDKAHNIAAGTSTGGLTNKKFGRIGDSPLIGAGTYANNNTCGVSCTGIGAYFIRTLAAHEVSNLIQYKNDSLKVAINKVIHHQITNLGGAGGMIAIDKYGNIAWDFNTKGMFRAYKKSTGEHDLKFFSIEK